ncbi:MAG: sulfatase-like hydrolase/transferase [Solobacterium sp.]|nr:sulfatase-like hydrolase/transferase [Solobacterium sp.]
MSNEKKPNIIIFNPDEMRVDAMRHMGNPAALTPFLDSFAQTDAVSFRNAVCQNPVCVPSRCSFFTGLYPHVNGHRTMSYLLRPGENTLFNELKKAGYYVWMNARNDLYAGQYENWFEASADEIEYGENYKQTEIPKGQREEGDKDYYSHYEGKIEVQGEEAYYSKDDADVDACIERIKNKKTDQPFCMFLGLYYPHVPYKVEEPYYSMIDRTKLLPRILPEACSNKPRIEEMIRTNQNMQAYTEEDWNELRAVYLAMCTKVDTQFKKVCDALKEAGEYDNTAIFFFSDHGDFTGDYGLSEKAQNCFEDCLVKVPFLVKPPKGYEIQPGISDSLVELVDFYATAMEFANVEPDHTHFGKSVVPILKDPTFEQRTFVYCEGGRMPGEEHCDEFHANGKNGTPKNHLYWPRHFAQTDDDAHTKGTMIRNHKYKYILRNNGKDEFYDLEKDHGETTNCIASKEYENTIRDMQIELLRWYQATCDIVPKDYDKRFNKKMLKSMMYNACENEEEKAFVDQCIEEGDTMGAIFGKLRAYRNNASKEGTSTSKTL